MSFLGGPECSTAANPLAQFAKQTSADTSLQRDRLTSRPGQQQGGGFRSAVGRGAGDDAAFAEFAQAQAAGGPQMLAGHHPAEAFHLEQMRREAEHLARTGSAGGGGGGGWASEFAQQGPGFAAEKFGGAGFDRQDFAAFMQQSAAQRAQSPTAMTQGYSQRSAMYSGGGAYGMQRPMMFQGAFQPMQHMPQEQQYEGKGKGKIQELSDTDWEKQFAELSTADKEADLDQLDREAQEAIERELNQADRDMMAQDELQNAMDDFDQWKDFDGLSHDFDGLRSDIEGYNNAPQLGTYLFEEHNVFMDVPNAFEEGQKIMREGGNLSLAALAFEAAVQKDPDFTEAWVALGQAQAQNEKESPAIRALEKALEIDPNNLDALMGLAVSYTNEGYDTLAYRTLERWVGIKYPSLNVPPRGLDPGEEMGFTDRHILHEKVTNYYLEAAQLNPTGGGVDVDVQVGLGVLFYGSEEYDKAVDCFTAALNSHQHGSMKREGEEHLLWNRLGATLANSSRSEEAIEAYSRALELRPNFVRARYNLGVSCINLGVLEEAAGHLLGALSMHRVLEQEGRAKAAELLRDGAGNAADARAVDQMLHQNQSTNLYDTLRRVFTNMGRRDLSNMVGPDMNLDALRKEFDF